MKKLNLGCGNDIRQGYINLDVAELDGVDVVWDVKKLPLPFGKGEFDEILCNDILEHIDYIPLLKDLHRILKKDGVLKIRVPHFTSANNYRDPTHKKMFSILTFDFFVKGHGRDYYFDFEFGEAKGKITFYKRPYYFWNYLLELIFNLNKRMRIIYEETPFRFFPAENLLVEMRK
ncbi:hypothetical protein COU57_05320 [Candidatus Pacearchaeota archaeon CG10_big_fil_rev_8_21_14_0_10_32_14]|nr:MAG: hypothetical protein COU57_05320 [Candidatus Pacearchaeota archaeon CG10_big_fil_rev_8_21_14_0_10_32_14]